MSGRSFPEGDTGGRVEDDPPDLRLLFHRLNNQLGIILSHAELLESKATDATTQARAAQVVTSALEAMGTVRDIRNQLVSPADAS